MIEGIEDLAYLMGWEKEPTVKSGQKQLFVEFNDTERTILSALQGAKRETLDNLSLQCGFPVSKTTITLLELEFKGMVKSMPGKTYELA